MVTHPDFVPPEDPSKLTDEQRRSIRTELDVSRALDELGHTFTILGVQDELLPLRRAIETFKPHVVFNLLEEFHSHTGYDHNVVSYLELLKTPYTGSNPRGLIIGRDKALSKKIVHYHRIPAPRFAVMRRNRKVKRPPRLEFPLIVKSLTEDASVGISEASIVKNDDKLEERVQFIHQRVGTPAIVEEYVDGRELYVGVMGNTRLEVLPPWELFMDELRDGAPRIATHAAKWDAEFQKTRKVNIGPAANLDDGLRRQLTRVSKRIFRALGLTGYARIDYRLAENGRLYFLEANPNPDLSGDAEFAGEAAEAGYSYADMIHRLLTLGSRSLD